MATLKSFMEAHKIVSADFKISAKSGRKVRTQIKNVNDEDDVKTEDTQVVEGLGRGREDDEYHVPDPVRQPQHKIHVEITPKDSTVKQKRTATVSTHHGREHAVKTALAHYKKQGATVHSHQYGGVHEEVESNAFEKAIFETTDQAELRLLQLARLGLVDTTDVSKLKLAFDTLKADKPLTVQQRGLLLSVFTTLTDLVTGDISIFNRVKSEIQKESTEPSSRIRNLAQLALQKQKSKK